MPKKKKTAAEKFEKSLGNLYGGYSKADREFIKCILNNSETERLKIMVEERDKKIELLCDIISRLLYDYRCAQDEITALKTEKAIKEEKVNAE